MFTAGKPFRVTAVFAAGKPFSVATGSSSCVVEVKMVSQESVVDTSVGNPVVSPTTRLVSETSVLATILPSSIGLLTDIMYRLKGKDKPFSVLSAASESDMKELWLELEEIDQSLLFNEKHRKKDIPNFPQLVQFLSHCCQVRHYSFTIKKYGVLSCSLCRPVRMQREAFDTLSFLPDTVPGEEGHYRPFNDVFGTPTSEEFRPSLQTSKSKQRTMPSLTCSSFMVGNNLTTSTTE